MVIWQCEWCDKVLGTTVQQFCDDKCCEEFYKTNPHLLSKPDDNKKDA